MNGFHHSHVGDEFVGAWGLGRSVPDGYGKERQRRLVAHRLPG
jgi:hypothetical protein